MPEDKTVGPAPQDLTKESSSPEDWRNCKKCGAPPREQEMRNFDRIARDADIYCLRCGAFVRTWDPS